MATSGSFGMSGSGYSTTFGWSLSSQSIANNTSLLNWWWDANWASTSWCISTQAALWVDGAEVFRNAYNTSRRMYGGRQASGSRTIGHGSNGSRSFAASGEAAFIQFALNAWGSGSWDLPTIPRNATLSSASDFDDESNPSITWSNPAGSNLATLKAGILKTDGTTVLAAYRDITKTGSSYTFELTANERNALRAATPNSNTMVVRFYLWSVIGGNDQKSYIEKTLSIVNGDPTFSAFNYKDANTIVTAITGNDQMLVQGQSALQATITTAQKMTTQKSATPSTYNFQFANNNIATAYSDTASVVANLGIPQSAGAQRLNVRAYDSRANSALTYKDITVIPYTAPVINASVVREGGFETQTTLSIAGSFSLVQVAGVTKNAVNASSGVQYRYKRPDTSTWGVWTPVTATIGSDGKISVADILMNNDNNYQWNFEVKVTDKFGTTTVSLTLSVGLPILFIHKDKKVGVNKLPENGDLDVAGDIYSNGEKVGGCPYGVGDIYMTVNPDMDTAEKVAARWPNTTWEPFAPGRTLVGVDPAQTEFDTVGETGGSKTVTLGTNQIPSHAHGLTRRSGAAASDDNVTARGNWNNGANITLNTSSVGGGLSHDNLLPHITCYLWKRIN